jgi:hypothetical protein
MNIYILDAWAALVLGLVNNISSHQPILLLMLTTLSIEPGSIVIYFLNDSSWDFKEKEHEHYQAGQDGID